VGKHTQQKKKKGNRFRVLCVAINGDQYAPEAAKLPTTNGPFALGEGVRIATRDAGAATTLMDKVQVVVSSLYLSVHFPLLLRLVTIAAQIHPTGLVDPKNTAAGTVVLGAEALRAVGGSDITTSL
jgi:hypothetical protein